MIMSKETLIKSIGKYPTFRFRNPVLRRHYIIQRSVVLARIIRSIMYEMYKDKGITKVVGIESRGFIMGPILATRLNAGFIPIRKPGKLPQKRLKKATIRSMAKTQCRFTKMHWMKTM